jgi:hypothetical protein
LFIVYLLALIFFIADINHLYEYSRTTKTISNRSRCCQSEVCVTPQTNNFFGIIDAVRLALDVKSVSLKQANEN